MKRFEKHLLYIQSKTNYGADFLYCEGTPFSESDYRYLKAKDLISMQPAGDNEFYAMLTDYGITYFDDKKQERIEFLGSLLSKFLVGVITGVVSTLLIEHVIVPLL